MFSRAGGRRYWLILKLRRPVSKNPGKESEGKTGAGLYTVERIRAVTIIEVNVEPTPLTEERISDYLIQGKTGEILPEIVEEVKRLRK